MEDKDLVIKDLKAELYDLNKNVTSLQSFLGAVAQKLGLEGAEATLEGIMEAISPPMPESEEV